MKESHSPSASFCGVKRTPLHEEIAQCAQEIWLQSGKPADRDMAIWLEAEQRLHSAIPVLLEKNSCSASPTELAPVKASAKISAGSKGKRN
jgi:hypothetical protein